MLKLKIFFKAVTFMEMKEIKAIAKMTGITPGKMGKVELIRAIQNKEGNSPCFQSEIATVCGLIDCLWRDDCVNFR
jgi:hypothetical protein